MSQLGGQAAGAGAFGGSRHGLMEQGIGRDVRQQSGDMRVAGMAYAYSQGIGAFNCHEPPQMPRMNHQVVVFPQQVLHLLQRQ